MYHTRNVIWFYSYKLINIYQKNIAWRKNEMAMACDNTIFEMNDKRNVTIYTIAW